MCVSVTITCPHEAECDARDAYLISVQMARCAEKGEPAWVTDEDLILMDGDLEQAPGAQEPRSPGASATYRLDPAAQRKPFLRRVHPLQKAWEQTFSISSYR
jgi:hypothetical protein